MSINVRELLESRIFSRKSGKVTASRSFHIYSTATPITVPQQVFAIVGSNGLPQYGDEFPLSPGLIARDYDLSLVDGHTDLWLMRWDYSEKEFGGFITRSPSSPNYVEISASVSAERVSAWRALDGSQLAAMFSAAGPYRYGSAANPVDIGGNYMDSAGEPLQDIVRQVEFNVNETRSGGPRLLPITTAAWTRNSTTFLTCPPGQLLYVGATISRVEDDLFNIAHKFIADRWWHCRQMAISDAEGRPLLVSNPSTKLMHAAKVMFVQGFPSVTDFYNISPNFIQLR